MSDAAPEIDRETDAPLPAHRGLPIQALIGGVLAALVGFGSSFAIVVQGFGAVGATGAQAASGLTIVCLATGLVMLIVAFRTRLPIGIAWSTPGSALMIATGAVEGGYPAALGAFVFAGALILVAGFWRPLARLVGAIPPSLASAMLAGVLLKLCLAPFAALSVDPGPVVAVVAVFLVVGRFARLYAVPAAVAVALVLLVAVEPMSAAAKVAAFGPHFEWVTPRFTLGAIVGLGLPLFIVTMASQNIPGFAVLAAFGFRPAAGPLFRATGLASMLIAPFGGHTINLAAITAALIAGPDADPVPARRWIAAVSGGFAYCALAALAPLAVATVTTTPPVLIQAVAGLALLGAFGSSLVAGLKEEADRPAALVAFLLTASGLSIAGIGSAFWGLAAGIAVMLLHGRLRRAS